MAKSSTSYQKLADELREIDSLQGISSILSWDELVVMKPKSAAPLPYSARNMETSFG